MSRQQNRSSADGAIDPSLVQKKRARHRLVGAVVLCLLAVIIVPMVLESEPRPRDSDLLIEMAEPVREGEESSAPGPGAVSAAGDSAQADPAASQSGSGSQSAVRTIVSPPAEPAVTPPPVARPERQASPADLARADIARLDAAKSDAARQESSRQEAARQEAARQEAARQEASRKEAGRQDPSKAAAARSEPSKPAPGQEKAPARSDQPDAIAGLIERTDPSGSAAKAVSRKFLIQIGAYSNVQSARSVSDRAVQVGLRPYQETVKTAQGDWIRVRVGPFSTRQDAERAQQELKRAGVTAAIIVL